MLMTNRFHKNFQINGISFATVQEILNVTSTISPEIQTFLQDWFSNRETLSVNTSGSTGKPKPIELRKDFMINSAYKGPSVAANTDLTLNLGLNLRTSFNTEFGKFKFSSGGMNWYRQSRLTVWGNRSFNRTSIFHRRPSTALNRTPIARYENYYKNGLIDQGVRYGSRAFKGLFFIMRNKFYQK